MENKTAMQLMIEQIDSIKRVDPATMIHNLRQIAIGLLQIEKEQIENEKRELHLKIIRLTEMNFKLHEKLKTYGNK